MNKGIAGIKKASLLSIAILVAILFSASYGFFGTTSINTGNNYAIGFEEQDASYVMTTNADLAMTVDPGLLQSGGTEYIESTPGEIVINLANSGTLESILCTYEIWYHPTEVYNNSPEATGLEETVILGVDSSGRNTAFTFNIDGITDSTKILDGSILAEGAGVTSSQKWNFTFRHYNLDVNQALGAKKTFSGEIEVKPGDCTTTA